MAGLTNFQHSQFMFIDATNDITNEFYVTCKCKEMPFFLYDSKNAINFLYSHAGHWTVVLICFTRGKNE
jgi:hypothetical protein